MLISKNNSIRQNVTALMAPVVSQSRKRAIATIAKKNNISQGDAQFKQAKRIAVNTFRK